MDVIVLVKYVANVDDIPPDAWDLEKGTLRRGRLHMVANPLDDRALAAGRTLAAGEHDRTVAISMGPRSAERACRRAIAYGADEAVLLSDSAFAGADTLATARVLARAIERAVPTFGLRDPLVLAGMQSPDGDTAQVPAEVAAILGLPIVPYASRVCGSDGAVEAQVVRLRGRALVRLHSLPAVVTLTSLAEPLPFHTSLARLRDATSTKVHRWRAADLGLAASETGLAGSATRVTRIEAVRHGRTAGTTVVLAESADPAAAVERVVAALAADLGGRQEDEEHERVTRGAGAHARTDAREAASAAAPSHASGTRPVGNGPPVFVLAERSGDEVDEGSLELLGEARVLADALGVDAVALLCGPPPSATEETSLRAHGATRVLVLRSPAADRPSLRHHTHAALLAAAALAHRPRTILIPASLGGRTVSALAAAMLGAGLTADCTALEVADRDGPGRGAAAATGLGGSPAAATSADAPAAAPALVQVRPALGGNVLAWIVSTVRDRGLPEMATVRSGVFSPRRFDAEPGSVPVEVERPDISRFADRMPQDGWCTVEPEPPPEHEAGGEEGAAAGASDARRGVDVDADIVVAAGAGLGDAGAVERLVEPLRAALAERFGVTTSLACSRAAVEAGILPYEYQIGQTGKSVRPRLYVALGISGAIQHRLGMEHSARILSVNPDPEAPIHAVADHAIVATADEAAPLITRSLRARRQE